MYVGRRSGRVKEARAIGLNIFHYALHIVAGLDRRRFVDAVFQRLTVQQLIERGVTNPSRDVAVVNAGLDQLIVEDSADVGAEPCPTPGRRISDVLIG
jgi:hypothetical protein